MQFDQTVRALTGLASPTLIRMIAGAEMAAELPTGFPTAQDRRVDVLAQLADGRILQVEWQSRYDATMPRRMLGYWLVIDAAYDGAEIVQAVIQVGGGRRIEDQLVTPRLFFHYQVIDSRAVDPAPLLASPSLQDKILSLLFCAESDLRPQIHAILAPFADLEPQQRRDALSQLLVLAGVRGVVDQLVEECATMPIQLEPIHDRYLLNLINEGRRQGFMEGRSEGWSQGRSEGRVEGEVQALIRLLERRFHAVPTETRERIHAAAPAQVNTWFDRAVEATSLDAVFANAPIH